jgi:hypothetical protein
MKWTEFLRGHNGGLEINRLVGFIGGVAYIASAITFQWWNWATFDVTAFCLAFSGGLSVIVGGTAGAVALKDRQVASAAVIAETGSKPAKPPAPAPKPQEGLDDGAEDKRPPYAR